MSGRTGIYLLFTGAFLAGALLFPLAHHLQSKRGTATVPASALAYIAQSGGGSTAAGGGSYVAWGTSVCAAGYSVAYTGVIHVGESSTNASANAGYALTNTICSATTMTAPTFTNATGITRLQYFRNSGGEIACAMCVK